MKKLNFIALISIITLFILTACEKPNTLGTIDINRPILTNIYINEVEKGELFDTVYEINIQDIKKIIEEKGTSNIKLTSMYIKKISLSIPDSFNFGFEDLETVKLSIGSQEIGSLPANTVGKKIDFDIPTEAMQDNFKSYYDQAKNISILCTGKAKNHIPKSIITAEYLFNIKADVILE